MDDDNDVRIKLPKELLCKSQFTMHLIFNPRMGKQGYGWCDIFYKDLGKRIYQAEKELWADNYVNIFW